MRISKEALRKYYEDTGTSADIASSKFVEDLIACDNAEAVSTIIDSHTKEFKEFRKYGGKTKDFLKRAVPILKAFADAAADATSAIIPGSKLVVAGITVLLKAAEKVSELYDSIESMLGKVGDALNRFETYLQGVNPISTPLSGIFVRSLVVILHLLRIYTKLCVETERKARRKVFLFGRELAKAYFATLVGNTDFKDQLAMLKSLSTAEARQAIAEMHADARIIRSDVGVLKQDVFELKDDQEYRNIKKWVRPPDVSALHNAVWRERLASTCDWIFEDAGFKRWRYSPNSLYSILGHAGSGKSVLCSLIIERLQKEVTENPTFTLAYFYFHLITRSRSKDNDSRALASALLFQIACASGECWEKLKQEWTDSKPGCYSQAPDRKIHDMLHSMLQSAGPTIIVIDALDECHPYGSGNVNEQVAMLKLLIDLVALELPNLHILVSSRPEAKILGYLAECEGMRTTMTLESHSMHYKDLEVYITERLSQPEFRLWTTEMREKAQGALTNTRKSEGMFLWVSLQLQQLEQCPPGRVENALDELPEGLDETYRGILERFHPTRSAVHDVRAVLGLIAFSHRPLTPREVATALAFDFANSRVFPGPLPGERDAEAWVLQCLPGLVQIVWDSEHSTAEKFVQFIHFSVKEYLIGDRLRGESSQAGRYYFDSYYANTTTASLLLAALDLTLGPALENLKGYAMTDWYKHICPCAANGDYKPMPMPPVLEDGMWKVVGERLNASLTTFLLPTSRAFKLWSGGYSLDGTPVHAHLPGGSWTTPLHMAVYIGLHGHTERLIGYQDINSHNGGRETPLWIAVERASFQAHLDIVDLLLSRGADRYIVCAGHRSIMHYAVDAPAQLMNILIKHGADVNAISGDVTGAHKTVLWSAARKGKESTVRALIELGADKDRISYLNGTALRAAVEGHSLSTVRVLLEKQALIDLSGRWDRSTPLHCAAESGDTSIVSALLASGANAGAKDIDGSTPLHFAAQNGHMSVCELLLARMPHLVNVPDCERQTPLHSSEQYRQKKIARLLLRFGADPDAIDYAGDTPLTIRRAWDPFAKEESDPYAEEESGSDGLCN